MTYHGLYRVPPERWRKVCEAADRWLCWAKLIAFKTHDQFCEKRVILAKGVKK